MVMDAAARHDYVTVHTVVGESGQPMSVIKKNGVFPPPFTANAGTGARAYAATLFEVAAIARLAAAAGKTYGLGAITLIHGEADAGNLNYANDIFQLYSDYNADLPALTGQTASIPMLVSQQNSVPSPPARCRSPRSNSGRSASSTRATSSASVPSTSTTTRATRPAPHERARVRQARREDGPGLLRARRAGPGLAAAAADQRDGERQHRHRPVPRAGAAAGLGRHAAAAARDRHAVGQRPRLRGHRRRPGADHRLGRDHPRPTR